MKFYVIEEIVGGIPAFDPMIFTDRKKAIARYLQELTGWDAPECGAGHVQPFPTQETFDHYWDEWYEAKCFAPDCSDTWEPTSVGHDDDDLYFYDGLEAE